MSTTTFIVGMRDAFFDALYPFFQSDPDAIFITADNGAPTLDKYGDDLPNQFYNVGIAEQQLIGMAAGFALEGHKVYCYAIAPFITLRCYESTKLDVCGMNLPVVLLGVGAGYAYDIMGPTHHTVEDITIMRALPNLVVHCPADSVAAKALAEISFQDPRPQYIRFDRAGVPELYTDKKVDFSQGVVVAREGSGITIAATGIMVHQALKVAQKLAAEGWDPMVLDVCRLKPLNKALLLEHLSNSQRVITMEEHLLAGGFGSSILELLADADTLRPVLRLGQNDRFAFEMGGREEIWATCGLDVDSAAARIKAWLKTSL